MENEITQRVQLLQDALSQNRQSHKLLEKRMDHQDQALDRMGRDVQTIAEILAEAFPPARANQPTREHREASEVRLGTEPLRARQDDLA